MFGFCFCKWCECVQRKPPSPAAYWADDLASLALTAHLLHRVPPALQLHPFTRCRSPSPPPPITCGLSLQTVPHLLHI